MPTRETPQPIKLREWDGQHGAPDGFDPDRIRLVRQRWDGQSASLLRYERTVEENVRMLAGRQWDTWSPVLGQYVDPTRYMSDSERRWRQRPVVNVLQYWFLLTHARVTETPPIITFQPASADRLDAMLAETMDVVFKTLWTGELDMDDVVPRAAAWLVAAGETYFETCAEYGKSAEQYQLQAPATLTLDRGDGSEPITRDTEGPVPYGVEGNPLASLVEQGDDFGFDVPEFGDGYQGEQPAMVKEGSPKVRVYSPLEVRSEWGANIPWNDKRWITIKSYLNAGVVKDTFGVEVKPDSSGTTGDLAGGAGVLQRMLFGAGNFSSVSNWNGGAGDDLGAAEEYVTVYTMWEKPSEVSPEDADQNFPAGGRLLIVTPTEVLHDSARPYKTAAAGPIRRAQFVQMPGRAGMGSTPLEQMVPIQKTYNRGWAQILEHRNRCTNPILVCDEQSGVSEQVTNVPGQKITADFSVAAQPAYYLAPPSLPTDVWRIQEMLFDLMMRLGSISGTEGKAPTDDPSGELIAQLRFNSDRPVAIAVRSLAYALAGVADDLVAVLPTCWPMEKMISFAGDDAVLRTITVAPEMWDGHVNIRPDITSAVPESPPARQARMERLWTAGAFGDPLTQGRKVFLESINFPNIARATRADGGIDKVTCERFLTQLVQGAPVQTILPSLKPFYNYDVMLETTRNHLASPEYLSYEPPIQQNLDLFFQAIMTAGAQAAQLQAAVMAPKIAAQAALEGTAARVAAEHGPPPDEGASMTHGGPSQSGPSKTAA